MMMEADAAKVRYVEMLKAVKVRVNQTKRTGA